MLVCVVCMFQTTLLRLNFHLFKRICTNKENGQLSKEVMCIWRQGCFDLAKTTRVSEACGCSRYLKGEKLGVIACFTCVEGGVAGSGRE